MFPSSGLFADINCPFSKRGLCERPHCLYKHAAELRGMFGASPIVDFAGVQGNYPYADCRASANDPMKDVCLQELERISQEIETVKHEVEREQKRLSHYQTVQADSKNTVPNLPKYETVGKNVDRRSYGLSSCTKLIKTYSLPRKYVVDSSKPRTDLEYDPLSNFSADLRSYSSSGKEQKMKNGQGLKRTRNTVPGDQKKPVTYQAQLCQMPSPEPLDDSSEDCVLIIDVPPSPDKKRGRVQKPVDSVAGRSLQDKLEEMREVKTMPTVLHSPPLHLAEAETCRVRSQPASVVEENKVYSNCSAEISQGPFNLYEKSKCENKLTYGSVVDLTGCLEDLSRDSQKTTHFQVVEAEVEKSPEPSCPPATTDQQTWNNLVVEQEENTFQVDLLHHEFPHSVEEMDLQELCNFPSRNSLFYKAPAANSHLQCAQQSKHGHTTESPDQSRTGNQCSSTKSVLTVLPRSQKTSSKVPGQMHSKAAVNWAPHESYLEQTEPIPGSSQAQFLRSSSASSLTNRAEPLFASEDKALEKVDNEEVIIIESSSDEDDLNYSEMELSDSDPMEECYRIFMEENEGMGNEQLVSDGAMDMDMETPEFKDKPWALQRKKRVAHVARHSEPVTKSRPQPKVLVPLRGPAVPGFTSRVQQVQQTASMLTASVKGGQAFISSTCQKRPETQNAPSPSSQNPENPQPAPVQNAYLNCIPLGTAVINMGNNLHLILPEAPFSLPVTSSSNQVTSVLTPISHVQTRAVPVKQSYYPPAVTSVQRYQTTAPVLIPAPARKPSQTSAFASAHSSPAVSTTPLYAGLAPVKPAPTRRKLKQQCEAAKDKVPHDLRQSYVNKFTEEFLKTTANANDAFEKALAEERTVYNRSVNKLKYQSVAVNALKRLKSQNAAAAAATKEENKVNSQSFKGNIPLNLKKFKGNDDMALYEGLKNYILSEEKLIESNFPVQHPEKPGCAVLFADNKKGSTDPLKRICCRCGATFSVSQMGKHIRKEECNYHYGKGIKNKVPGGVETRYSCCEGVMGAPGCQVFKLHVHNSLSLDGFVLTVPRHPSDTSCPGVYSLDCEMCYTVQGLELSRVTLVNSSLQVIYDTFVKPDNEVIDYNTRFSGITEDDMKGNHTSLREVQETLLSFINADTILIGHSLETDLCALKFLHGTVVDTSVVFPHRLGPPHKLTLNNLTADYLRRIIQESVCGHDTAEDAAACMELMLWKVKEDGKFKK